MEHQCDSDRVIFKLLYILKRQTDKMAASKLATIVSGDFNITYMPYFMNIGNEGISNHELVHKIKVTKQGVSKTVKELERLGLVYTAKAENDARSIMIYLTDEGKSLYSSIYTFADEAKAKYVELIGAKKYEQFIDTIVKLSDWHESQEQ